jgi:hypothetical protein
MWVLHALIGRRHSWASYPDAGHGSLFQYHESFVTQASQFLDAEIF